MGKKSAHKKSRKKRRLRGIQRLTREFIRAYQFIVSGLATFVALFFAATEVGLVGAFVGFVVIVIAAPALWCLGLVMVEVVRRVKGFPGQKELVERQKSTIRSLKTERDLLREREAVALASTAEPIVSDAAKTEILALLGAAIRDARATDVGTPSGTPTRHEDVERTTDS